MASLLQWQNEIKEGGNKAHVTAAELLKAEADAYTAYDARVREMTYSGRGVTPHRGNNQKMEISACLSMLARGWDDLFKRTVKEYAEKASRDPARYSPLSYALKTLPAGFYHRSESVRPRPCKSHAAAPTA